MIEQAFFFLSLNQILQEWSWYLVWQCVFWASNNRLNKDKRLRAIKSDICVKAVKTVFVTTGGL